MVPRLARRGAYFSFNGRFLDPRFQRAMDTFRHVPHDRLLIETDAPSMRPPASHVSHPLPATADGRAPNHPANLAAVYPAVATLLNLSEPSLRSLIKANFEQFFGPPPAPPRQDPPAPDALPPTAG
jgi:TatD DNase family protein